MTGTKSRRILLVYPRFPGNNILNYGHMAPFFPGRRAVMPPLGLLTFAGCLDERFDIRMDTPSAIRQASGWSKSSRPSTTRASSARSFSSTTT